MFGSIQLEIITAAAGVLASLLSVLTSAVFSRFAKKAEDPTLTVACNEQREAQTDVQKWEQDARIIDLRIELERQVRSALWSSRSATLLTSSQYIVGGTLATSFVQTTLPQWAIGLFGLIVLLSSTTHQHFRPDLRRSSTLRRAAALREALRKAEDGLLMIRDALPDAPTVHKIRADVTAILIQVERSEIEDNAVPSSI